MSQDYFAILGLSPGRHERHVVTQRYLQLRDQFAHELAAGRDGGAGRRKLDRLHIAFTALCDPNAQMRYLRAERRPDNAARLRTLIEASLEDGLLRYSRRREIMDEGRRIGFSDFQTHLLIAQTQFGDDQLTISPRSTSARGGQPHGAFLRLAAAGCLGAALFLAMFRWLAI